MSMKIDRINSIFVKEISYILEHEIKDKDIRFVTITDCKVTNDLSFAKVYFTVLNENKIKETSLALKNASGFIRKTLSERVDIRHTPELIFIFDKSIDYGKKIEDKIKEIHDKEDKE